MCTKSLRLFRHKQIDPQMWALVIHPVNVFMLNTTNWIGIRNVLSEQNKCGCGLHGIFRTKKKKKANKKQNIFLNKWLFFGFGFNWGAIAFLWIFMPHFPLPFPRECLIWQPGRTPPKTLRSPLCSSRLEMTKKSKNGFKSYLEAMLILSHPTCLSSFLFHFFPCIVLNSKYVYIRKKDGGKMFLRQRDKGGETELNQNTCGVVVQSLSHVQTLLQLHRL